MDRYPENDFIAHFKTVFEEYEDTSADEGWLKLREKYPEEEKKKFLLWSYQGMAASFTLFMLGMAALYFMTRPLKKHPVLAHSGKRADVTRPSASPKTMSSSKDNDSGALQAKRLKSESGFGNSSASENSAVSENSALSENSATAENSQAHDRSVAKGLANQSQVLQKHGDITKQTKIPESLQASAPGTKPQKEDNLNNPTDDLSENPLQTSSAEDLELLSSINPSLNWNREPIAIHSDFKKINEDDPMLEITWTSLPNIARERKVKRPGLKSAKTIARKQDPFELGLFAGSYENYAKGSTDHTSVGGGVSGDIPLFKNVKLSTGLSVNPTEFDFNSDGSNLTSSYAAVPAALNISSLNAVSYNGYEASLLGLDVPLNLKYTFHLKKHYKVYVVAGVSSSLLLNQSYAQKYSSYSADAYSGLKTYSVTSDAATGGTRISDFNFAGLLNLSAGFGYPLGKSDFLVIEPFFKYPLHTPANQSIPVSYGGVNLRFNFSPVK